MESVDWNNKINGIGGYDVAAGFEWNGKGSIDRIIDTHGIDSMETM